MGHLIGTFLLSMSVFAESTCDGPWWKDVMNGLEDQFDTFVSARANDAMESRRQQCLRCVSESRGLCSEAIECFWYHFREDEAVTAVYFDEGGRDKVLQSITTAASKHAGISGIDDRRFPPTYISDIDPEYQENVTYAKYKTCDLYNGRFIYYCK